MNEHFLKDVVSGDQCFLPEPWYNPDGDCVVFKLADEAIVADRVDEVLTIYRSAVDDRPIGFQIKGALALIKRFGWDALEATCRIGGDRLESVSVTALLLAAYETGPKSIGRRSAYAQAFQIPAGNKGVSRRELQLTP